MGSRLRTADPYRRLVACSDLQLHTYRCFSSPDEYVRFHVRRDLPEGLIGSRRMFMSYLLTGLCSAVFSLYMHGETISAGASGAIFGLYGIPRLPSFFHRIAKGTTESVIDQYPYFCRLQSGLWHESRIDNAAHIGGLLSGFLLGIIYVCSYKFEKADAQRTVSILGELGIFCIFLFSFLMLCKNVPPFIRTYAAMGKRIVEAYLNGELEEENEKW